MNATSCSRCAATVKPSQSFCPRCGAPINDGSAAPASAPPPLVPAPPPPAVDNRSELPPPQVSALPTVPPPPPQRGRAARTKHSRRTMIGLLALAMVGTILGVVIASSAFTRDSPVRQSGNTTAAPAPDTTLTSDPAAKTPISTEPTTTPTPPPTPPTTPPATATATVVATPSPTTSRFPTSPPAGSCDALTITHNASQAASIVPVCHGVWATADSNDCGNCEGVTIYRWNTGGWVLRGRFNAACPLLLTDSGMPFDIATQFVGDGYSSCAVDRHLVAEPATGPLERSHDGPRVVRLQRMLSSWGLFTDSIDGQFGPNTRAATIDFQYLVGLAADGIAGAATHAALGLSYP